MTPRDKSPDRLFMRDAQLELLSRSAEQRAADGAGAEAAAGDDARRAAYLERLRAVLPELRKVEGFPVGSDEDILALSDPPYYTACPNPFLGEFVAEHGTRYDEATDAYHREPFAADVSEGKNDPIYNAHSYHTKVPHKAIMRYILHYTKPGDIVFDSFCGTGMTGVAAQLCGSPDPAFRAQVEAEWRAAGHKPPEWGTRYAVLGDLSPAATFIAYNYNTPLPPGSDGRIRQAMVSAAERYGSHFVTRLADTAFAVLDYAIWSDVYGCPACGTDLVFWAVAVDESRERVREAFTCPRCGTNLVKANLERRYETVIDPVANEPARTPAQVPVKMVARADGRRVFKDADDSDLAQARAAVTAGHWADVPLMRIDPGDEADRNLALGMHFQHQYFTWRQLLVISWLWRALRRVPRDLSLLTSALPVLSKMNRWPRQRGPLNGTLYLPAVAYEYNPLVMLAKRAPVDLSVDGDVCIATTSAASLEVLPDASVDYIFTDPPFGSNLQYSDLNALTECWLRVHTQTQPEAVTSRTQGKSLLDYQTLMQRCFQEGWRVLKPGRWMTVEFHNSSNAVWNAIQEAIQRAGFVVADVRTIDKSQGTFKQIMTSGAVKQDLVISAYKPRAGFEQRFSLEAGTEQGAWDFARQHLEQLPVFVERGGLVEVVAERQDYLLFDRMVAFHIQRGVTVPLSASAFYAGLRQRFPERDGMFFTELQAAEYDQRRLEARDVEQLSVFVVDEKTAITWLRVELGREPRTFQDLQPRFLRELQQSRYEALPELRDILDQNFLEDSVTHRWRVPDPGRQADLEALRQRALLAEFASYRAGTGRLKRFRVEAVRAGFADLWAQRDYAGIIAMAERLPDEVVQEDPALLMYYDNAVTRAGR